MFFIDKAVELRLVALVERRGKKEEGVELFALLTMWRL
jgi:hypothetical protein